MGLRSIRWRLVLSNVLLALLAVSLVGVLALTLLRKTLEQQETAALQDTAQAIAQQALQRMHPGNRPSNLSQLVQTSAFLANARVRILDADGTTVLVDSGDQSGVAMWLDPDQNVTLGSSGMPYQGPVFMLPSGQMVQMPSGVPFTSVKRVDTPWGSMLVFETNSAQSSAGSQSPAAPSGIVAKATIGPAAKPVAYVEVSGGPNFTSQALASTQAAFLWAALVAALIAAVIGLFVSRGLTAPLASLAKAANQMSSGDLSVRAPVRSRDEIGQLAVQVNQMAGGLETSFKELSAERDTLRRFVADASHELRTPITALQAFTDLMEGSASGDPQARAEFLAESQKQLARLEWITRNLLDLSRLDAGIESLERADYDVAGLTRSAASTFEPAAREKQIELVVTVPTEPAEVNCDRARFEMALSNLLQNALKFTPLGGRVELRAEVEESRVRWTVEDNGPGIPLEDQPHIFERFYRGVNPGPEGSGLGLAIVQSIAEAHHGSVRLESQPGLGSRFTLEIPR